MVKDSTYYINRYPADQQFYSIFPTVEYLQKTGLNVDFKGFQYLFFGDMPLRIEKTDLVTANGNNVKVVQKRNNLVIESKLDKEFSKLQSFLITSVTNKDTLSVKYDNYQFIEGKYIPNGYDVYIRKVTDSTNFKSKATIELTNRSFNSEDMTFNFNIPDSYEKR